MKHTLLPLLMLLICLSLNAQSNLELAQEALTSEDYERAVYYAEKQIEKNPKDADAYYYHAVSVYYHDLSVNPSPKGVNKLAIDDIDKGISLWNKKCTVSLSTFYRLKGFIYCDGGIYGKALDNYNIAIKKDKEDPRGYRERGLLFSRLEQNEQAEADLKKALELGIGDVNVILELSRIWLGANRYDEANALLDELIHRQPRVAEAYRLRALSAFLQEDYKTAVDHLIPYHSLTYGDLTLLNICSRKEYAYTLNAVTRQITGTANMDFRAYWYGNRAQIYMANDMFEEAVNDLLNKKTIDADTTAVVYNNYQLGLCYDELEQYQKAADCYTLVLDELNKARQGDSEVLLRRSEDFLHLDSLDLARADAMQSFNVDMQYATHAYYLLSKICEKQGQLAAAVDECRKGLKLDSASAKLHLQKAKLHLALDSREEAYREFDAILRDKDKYLPSFLMFVYFYHDMTDEAVAQIDLLLKSENLEKGDYYNLACIYSLLKDKDTALLYFQKSLENGYRQFLHLDQDTDLDFIRQTDEFQSLLKKYRNN